MSEGSVIPGPMEISIRKKLTDLLEPTDLTIKNDSWKHRHHTTMRERNGDFSIRVVSDAFEGKSPVQRHRMINSALSEEFTQGLHALSLNTKTEEEIKQATQ
ncbi:BolA domain UV induced protein Uvi31 [Leucoagaricus gongylophorus]